MVGVRNYNFATFGDGETVMDLCSGLSNVTSECDCNYLSATTDRRALLYDMRCIGRPLISWELPQVSGFPTVIDMYTYQSKRNNNLSNLICAGSSTQMGRWEAAMPNDLETRGYSQTGHSAESVGEAADTQLSQYSVWNWMEGEGSCLPQTQQSQFEQIQSQNQPKEYEEVPDSADMEGSLLISSLVTGHILQLPFLVASGGTVLIPEEFNSDELEEKLSQSIQRRNSRGRVRIFQSDREKNLEGVPEAEFLMRYSYFQRILDVPSLLCRRLCDERRLGGIAGVDLYNFLQRLSDRYQYNSALTFRALDKEIMDWQTTIGALPDCLGVAFIPFLHKTCREDSIGILIRQNSIGDIVVNLCVCRKDELGSTNPRSNCSESGSDDISNDGAFVRNIKFQKPCGKSKGHLQQFKTLKLARNESGCFRILDLTKSNLGGSSDCLQNGRWSSGAEKGLRSIPSYFGRRLQYQCNIGDPIPLNAFSSYLASRGDMVARTAEMRKGLEDWNLGNKAAELVSSSGNVLTVAEIQRTQAIDIYRQSGAHS